MYITRNIYNVFLVLFLALVFSKTILAREITVGFGEGKPPYVMDADFDHNTMYDRDNKNRPHGIEIDIFREALALSGHTLKVKIMPKARLKRSIKTKRSIDAVSAVNLSKDKLHYSDVMVTFVDFAVSKASNNISLNSIADLAPYTVSAWPGAYTVLGNTFAKLYGKRGTHKQNYTEYSNQLFQHEDFWSNKTEVMVLDRFIFAYFKKQLANKYATSQPIKFNHLFGHVNYRAAFKDKRLRDQFNDGLSILRFNGKYQEIIDRYTK